MSIVALTVGLTVVTTLVLDVFVPFNCFLRKREAGGHCGQDVTFGTFFFFKVVIVTKIVVFIAGPMRTTRTNSSTKVTAKLKCLTTTLSAKLSYINNNVTMTDTTDTTLKTVDRSPDTLNGSLVFMNLTRNMYLCKLVVSFVVVNGLK